MADNQKSKTLDKKPKPKTATGGSGGKPPKRPPTKTGGSGDRDKDSQWDRPNEGGRGSGYPKSEPKPKNDYMRYNRGKKDK